MSINAVVVHETSNPHPLYGHDVAVRLIGDILPSVLAKYGIDVCDDPLAATQVALHEYDFAI